MPSETVSSIMDDPRPIKKLMFLWRSVEVGKKGVTEIVCYREAGQMAHVPWFAVYVGDDLRLRVSGADVAVFYKKVGDA